jgi:hypothetical protein
MAIGAGSSPRAQAADQMRISRLAELAFTSAGRMRWRMTSNARDVSENRDGRARISALRYPFAGDPVLCYDAVNV